METLCPVSDVIVVQSFENVSLAGLARESWGCYLCHTINRYPMDLLATVIPIWFLVPDGPNSDDDLNSGIWGKRWHLEVTTEFTLNAAGLQPETTVNKTPCTTSPQRAEKSEEEN